MRARAGLRAGCEIRLESNRDRMYVAMLIVSRVARARASREREFAMHARRIIPQSRDKSR